MRGEYNNIDDGGDSVLELPPRARRIHATTRIPNNHIGTTSACAENTNIDAGKGVATGNYLRVRGEYSMGAILMRMMVELPPRARRILNTTGQQVNAIGTTSACAENT